MILRPGAVSVGVVWVCMLVLPGGVAPAVAEIVSVDLLFAPPAGDINRMNITLTITLPAPLGTSSDTETSSVTGNILADLTIDFDPVTHGAVATGLEFTGGAFDLSPLDFELDYGFLVGKINVDGQDMRGTVDTPLPPGTVADGHFPSNQHVAIINYGTLTMEGSGWVLGGLMEPTTINLADDPIAAPGQGSGTLTVSPPTVLDNMATYDVTTNLPMTIDIDYTDPGTGVTARIEGSAIFRATGQFPRMLPPAILTWDGTASGQWLDANWTPGPVAPVGWQAMVVDSGKVTVASDLTATPYLSLAVASVAAGGEVNIPADGKLVLTGDVTLGAGGTLGVDGVLVAGGISVTGGSLTNNGVGLVGTARLTVSGGVVSATYPITITERLAIGSEPVISVTDALFGIKGADLLNDPVRELTLQGGEVTIDSGPLAIDMPGTDIIVVDDTILNLGAATSATFDELVFGVGSVLTIASDSPVSLFFGSMSGEGTLAGAYSEVTITGLLSPGDTGRVLTIVADPSAAALADYSTMLGALGFEAEAGNVAMACLDGDSYPVSSTIPEPATLSLLLIGGSLAVARRRRPRLSRRGQSPTEPAPLKRTSEFYPRTFSEQT